MPPFSDRVAPKVLVYGGVCTVLSAVVTGVFALFRDLPQAAEPVPPVVAVFGVIWLIMLASRGFGLVISAVSTAAERASRSARSSPSSRSRSAGRCSIVSYTDLNAHRRPHLYEDWMRAPGTGRFWALTLLMGALCASALVASAWCLQRRWTYRR